MFLAENITAQGGLHSTHSQIMEMLMRVLLELVSPKAVENAVVKRTCSTPGNLNISLL